MYVIVVGGGTVGYYLSRDLVERGHEVTLIEKDARRADWLETQLGSIVMRGDGCEVRFLAQTGIERADAIIAVTADDEDNLIALQMAKRHFRVKKTIARVMGGCLRSALSEGWQASEVRFVLFGEDAKTPFEAAFWPAFSEGSGPPDPNSV